MLNTVLFVVNVLSKVLFQTIRRKKVPRGAYVFKTESSAYKIQTNNGIKICVRQQIVLELY